MQTRGKTETKDNKNLTMILCVYLKKIIINAKMSALPMYFSQVIKLPATVHFLVAWQSCFSYV